jgi:hypothetical protein
MNEIPLPPSPPVPPAPLQPKKDFLETLQSLDEPMKRRVLVASSAVMMAVVVFLWIGYFNNIVMGNPSSQLADQTAVPIAVQPQAQTGSSPSAPGFWAQLGGGIASMYHGMVSDFKGAGSALQAPKQYDITPTQ